MEYKIIKLDKFDTKSVIREVAKEYDVKVKEILGRRNSPWIVNARWEVIRILNDIPFKLSASHIGRILGKDHSSILYALKKLNEPKLAS